MDIFCPSCNNNKLVLIGNIPPAYQFAGNVLQSPLEGNALYRYKSCSLYFRYPRLPKAQLDILYKKGNTDNWQYKPENRRDWEIAAKCLNKREVGKTVLVMTLKNREQKRINYRKLAFEAYDSLCAHCGFGIPSVLEVSHIDGDRDNNEVDNLVILCPNCHKMHDLDLISTETIKRMRDRPKIVDWSKRMKDAGKKAARTRKLRAAGKKAAETRQKNKEKS